MTYSIYPEVLFLIVCFSVFVWLKVKFKSEKAQKFQRMLWMVFVIIYSGALLWSVLISRTDVSVRSVTLTVFSSYEHTLRVYNSFEILKQIIDNILVFIPIGLFLPAAYNAKQETKNYIFVIFAGLVMSLIIEVFQYVLSRGFSEVDDIINNVWGCAIGCGLYALTGKIESKQDGVILKKGWFKCLTPLVILNIVFGLIWLFREYILKIG